MTTAYVINVFWPPLQHHKMCIIMDVRSIWKHWLFLLSSRLKV